MEEPSVLDYVKSRLAPWKYGRVELPPETPDENGAAAQAEALAQPYAATQAIVWPWRSIAAVVFALAAQSAFAPPDQLASAGLFLLGMSAIAFVWAYHQGEWQPAPPPEGEIHPDTLEVKAVPFGLGVLLAAVGFFALRDGQIGLPALMLLLAGLFFILSAVWEKRLAAHPHPSVQPWQARLVSFARRPQWNLHISRWTLLVVAAIALVLFFRLYRLDSLPSEMVSDHAEKYIDAALVLNGQPFIFFSNNGGREALQFYLLAAMHRFFGLPLDHLTLKLSTSLVGLLALPFVYLLGKEVANRRVGLLAFTFAGVAYWTNVVSRSGMRLPFYFLFAAAVLYFLVRGLQRSSRNDFLIAGALLGLSLYGYSADRLLPLVVVAAVGLYLLHSQSHGQRRDTVWRLALLVLVALVVFLPLLHYISQDPQGFSYRMFSRMGSLEQPLPQPAVVIFLQNTWNALRMFSWSAGVVWGVSIPNYPALGIVAGGLFYLGVALALARYVRRRHWLDLFWIVSIPLLMLPSILALAFPSENPNLYRTGGAMVPVFILVALALDGLMRGLEDRLGSSLGPPVAWGVALALVGLAAVQDYDLVFNQYDQNYRISAWNTSEMGHLIRDFHELTGRTDNAWVMGFPHWVDTRLVAINAGQTGDDYRMFVDQLPQTLENPAPKLFILHTDDTEALGSLRSLYPLGWVEEYDSEVETKDFLVYFTPPDR